MIQQFDPAGVSRAESRRRQKNSHLRAIHRLWTSLKTGGWMRMCQCAGMHSCCCSWVFDLKVLSLYRFAFTRNNYNLQSLTHLLEPNLRFR